MKKAFTLAEMMIALTIVGVIAILTVPALMSNFMHRICATTLKKTVAEIETATQTAIAEDGAYSENDGANFYLTRAGSQTSNANEGAQFFLTNYLKSSHRGPRDGGLFANAYKNSDGEEIGTVPSVGYSIKTSEGAAINMAYDNSYRRHIIYIDTNSTQGPNVAGVDLFVVQLSTNGIVETTDPDEESCGTGDDNFIPSIAGCINPLLQNNWNIDD